MPANQYQHADGLRAIIYNWISTASPSFAHALHDDKAPKPFNLGPLVPCDDGVGFEINILSDEVYMIFLQGYAISPASVRLGTNVYPFNGPIQLVDEASYEQLVDQPLDRHWSFRLLTPSAHHNSPGKVRIVVPVPCPANYFGSWLARWNLYSPYPIPDDMLMNFVSSRVGIESLNGQTKQVALEKDRFFTGYQGDVSFCAVGHADHDKEFLAALTTLACFSSFCHTGVDTLRGLGMTVRI